MATGITDSGGWHYGYQERTAEQAAGWLGTKQRMNVKDEHEACPSPSMAVERFWYVRHAALIARHVYVVVSEKVFEEHAALGLADNALEKAREILLQDKDVTPESIAATEWEYVKEHRHYEELDFVTPAHYRCTVFVPARTTSIGTHGDADPAEGRYIAKAQYYVDEAAMDAFIDAFRSATIRHL